MSGDKSILYVGTFAAAAGFVSTENMVRCNEVQLGHFFTIKITA